MPINVDYPHLLDNFDEYRAPKRSDSAAFLIWYLEQYYRLDAVEAVDAVCDQSGDKGVDGIFINESNSTITIFQSKISQNKSKTVGDASLRDFLGTLQQFQTPESVAHLMQTAGGAQVASLVKRSGLASKIGSYLLRGEFVTNIDLDKNGHDFLQQHGKDIYFVGERELVNSYISDERDLPKHKKVSFDTFGFEVGSYFVEEDIGAIIAPIKAKELVQLDGIEDQSLFAYNVRGPLGRTAVNRDLIKSVRDGEMHKLFPLFHNGVTIIARDLKFNDPYITIEDYFVVNGCQSITSLHSNRDAITDELRIITKFIIMDPASATAKLITEYSNNQNGVRSRDFKSNNSIQIRLQNEFLQNYGGVFNYEIKRGESSAQGEVISNEEAGLYLMAFDHHEPWRTHYKYEVFEDKHSSIFARPEVTADRIVLLRVIDREIVSQLGSLKEPLLAKYKLTRYMIIYILGEILADDKAFLEIVEHSHIYMRSAELRERFRVAISGFVANIIIDINVESDDFADDFDYRANIKDAGWVQSLTRNMEKDFKKNVLRGRQETFAAEWSRINAQ